MVKIVKRVIGQCRDGKEHEEIPFINSLLQNYDSEDKVNEFCLCFSVSLSDNPTSQERLWEELKQEVGGECGDRLREYAWRNDT